METAQTYTASIIDGKTAASRLMEAIKTEVDTLSRKPGLAVILVGDDPASKVYVGNKIKACSTTGIQSFEHRLPADTDQADIALLIEELNHDDTVDGILLQLPLPAGLDSDTLVQLIHPDKDVDGLTAINAGRLVAGIDGMVPCTPQGSLILLKETLGDLTGKTSIVIGRSLLFGKPMGQLLLAENATLIQAHSKTNNLPELCRQADIVVAAVGRPKMVKGDWLKPGATVIDVGINRLDTGKLCGDVAFEEAVHIAGAITPVPGGVGPMTIACLMGNTLKAAKKKR
jgi:methylenetetrahydrofolate dehydrogenase (NADP+)/methenyltetrahydrofolate cyclohydrolase